MLNTNTLSEIKNNINTGVEYEIALFYALLHIKPQEQTQVSRALSQRTDVAKIRSIISQTNTSRIESALRDRGFTLTDVTFETQNDEVGPADIVLIATDSRGAKHKIGLSVKYANTCTLNVTGRRFISDTQIAKLKRQLPDYTNRYIQEMTNEYGNVNNWFRQRKPSTTTDAYIDLIRDAVIENWPNLTDKTTLLSALFHEDSPIEFWVVTYTARGYELKTTPKTIDMSRANDVTIGKYQTSFIAFYLDGVKVGHMQVKFNNGFVEKCNSKTADVVYQGVRMTYGKPFSSWNFSVER